MGDASETLVRELFEMAGIQIGGPGPGDIQVHDSRFYGRVLRDASIGFGESYMDGWWETDALDVLIEKIMRADLQAEDHRQLAPAAADRQGGAAEPAGQGRARARRSRRTTTSATTSTRACSTRAWSTPAATGRTRRRWPRRRRPSSTSSAARSASSPGMRVLDLGCGWGGFASWAAEKYGCTVVGVTLSKDQVALGSEMWKHLRVELRLCDYRDVSGTFDRVVSIGMMEHVGPKNHRHVMEVDRPVPGRRRRRASSTRSRTTAACATARRSSRSTSSRTRSRRRSRRSAARSRGCSSSRTCTTSAPTTTDADGVVGELRPHLPGARSTSTIERFYRMWKFYLLAAAGASRSRDGQLYQLVLTKIGREQPDCRMS